MNMDTVREILNNGTKVGVFVDNPTDKRSFAIYLVGEHYYWFNFSLRNLVKVLDYLTSCNGLGVLKHLYFNDSMNSFKSIMKTNDYIVFNYYAQSTPKGAVSFEDALREILFILAKWGRKNGK